MKKPRIIGARITELREQKGWTMGQLALKARTNTANISRAENEQREDMSAPILGAIANALDTSVDYLLGLTDDPRPVTEQEDFEESGMAKGLLAQMPSHRRREALDHLRVILDHSDRYQRDLFRLVAESKVPYITDNLMKELVAVIDQMPNEVKVQLLRHLLDSAPHELVRTTYDEFITYIRKRGILKDVS